jgi:MFS superfamily sulfate permease-like transporter
LTKKTGFLSNLGTPTFIDLKSGITVGVIIIPQAMAYATLALPFLAESFLDWAGHLQAPAQGLFMY